MQRTTARWHGMSRAGSPVRENAMAPQCPSIFANELAVRIAHFSDLHLLSLEGVPLRRFLNKRATGYANLRLKRGSIHRASYVKAIAREVRRIKADHVVVTGDLTNLALNTGLHPFTLEYWGATGGSPRARRRASTPGARHTPQGSDSLRDRRAPAALVVAAVIAVHEDDPE